MTKTNMLRTFILILITGAGAIAVAQPARAAKTARKKVEARAAAPAAVDSGERVFAAQCSRCHNAPEQLSPRLTGTVVRHMRVRANLSEADERDLLRFFNP